MALALNHPDQWAECGVTTGNSFRHLAGNALNLPFIFCYEHPESNDQEPYFDFADKCFKFFGCKYFRSSKTFSETADVRGSLVPDEVRITRPERVLYTIESLHNPTAYWVKIDGRKDENLIARIDASVSDQTIYVKTTNIDAYTLDLIKAPIDANMPIRIIENGQDLGFVTSPTYIKISEKYVNAAYIKNESLSGPVSDAFTDSYIVVYGTGGKDLQYIKTSKEIAESLAKGAPCLKDTELSENTFSGNNLILIGSIDSNKWLEIISTSLPLQLQDGKLIADNNIYDDDDLGYILIYPNPLNSSRYVAVFSATSTKALSVLPEAFIQNAKKVVIIAF